jgi:hypothetical protein
MAEMTVQTVRHAAAAEKEKIVQADRHAMKADMTAQAVQHPVPPE